jgi:hypothetical protein
VFLSSFFEFFTVVVFYKHTNLSQNFSSWESNLRFSGERGLQAAFSIAFPETNRVLGKARTTLDVTAY